MAVTEHVLAISTMSDEEAARRLATELVSRRLIACANILTGARSIYRYRGVIEDEPECVLLMKTRRECFGALERALEALHPYEVPELILIPIEAGLRAYLSWIDDNVALDVNAPDSSE